MQSCSSDTRKKNNFRFQRELSFETFFFLFQTFSPNFGFQKMTYYFSMFLSCEVGASVQRTPAASSQTFAGRRPPSGSPGSGENAPGGGGNGAHFLHSRGTGHGGARERLAKTRASGSEKISELKTANMLNGCLSRRHRSPLCGSIYCVTLLREALVYFKLIKLI